MRSLSWILKAEEGWGEIEISTKGVVDRQQGGGAHVYQTQTWRLGKLSLVYNANLRSLDKTPALTATLHAKIVL